MKVAIVGTAGDGSLATAFARGARAIGHDAVVIDAPRTVAGSRPLMLARRFGLGTATSAMIAARVLRLLAGVQPEIVLVTKGRYLGRHGVEKLRRTLGVPLLNYYPDDPLWPGHNDPEILDALCAYDEVFTWGAHVADNLIARGVRRTRVIPFAYDPHAYTAPLRPTPLRWDVAFIGQCYPHRVPFAEALSDLRLLVTGTGWMRAAHGGPLEGIARESTVWGRETCHCYWQSAVGLNVLAEWNPPAHNMRTFEIPASGTAMVATRTPEHEQLFGENGAVLVESVREADEAVRSLIHDHESRDAIAEEGLRRVRPHTYAARIASILQPWTVTRPGLVEHRV
jgi:spore maturation protein CgeB